MRRLSSRFGWAGALLAAVAAIPVGWHHWAFPVVDPCADSPSLFELERLGDADVTERELLTPVGAGTLDGLIPIEAAGVVAMYFQMKRTFEPARTYGEAAISDIGELFALEDRFEVAWTEVEGERLPIYSAADALDPNYHLRMYMVIHDQRPVESPFLSGLALAPTQVVAGTRPVTVLALRADGMVWGAEAMREAGEQWIHSAWSQIRAACGHP